MTEKIIRIRAFLDENFHGQLLDQVRIDPEVVVHIIRENSDVQEWLNENVPSSDELLAVPLTEVPVDLNEAWEKSALLPRQDPGYSILLGNRDPEIPVIRHLQQPLRVFFHENAAKQQCEVAFPHWLSSETREEADAEIFQTRLLEYIDPAQAIFHMDPSEIIPLPGAGTICLLTPKSRSDLRSWARMLHDRSTANCTNIERSIAARAREKGLSGEVYAFSKQSDRGFDITAAYFEENTFKKVVRSVTSSAGAPETIVSEWS